MKKVICEVCGATYSDEVNRCPICGCVRNGMPTVTDSQTKVSTDDGDTPRYANGGRYSKANVQKRNNRKSGSRIPKEYWKFIAVGAVIFLLFTLLLGKIITSCSNGGGNPDTTTSETTAPTTESVPVDKPCTSVLLTSQVVNFSQAGETHKLSAFLDPEDTTDVLSFTTSDGNVVTVTEDGTITAVGNGTATITVTCGTAVATCQVTVLIPEPTVPVIEYTISNKDVTLYIGKAGWDRFSLYLKDPNGEKMEVEWVASKDGIVKIYGNTIKGIAPGVVYVRTTFGEKTYSCKVIVRNS